MSVSHGHISQGIKEPLGQHFHDKTFIVFIKRAYLAERSSKEPILARIKENAEKSHLL